MFIAPEPHGISKSNFTDLFKHCANTGMQNDYETLPSIILAGSGLLVKMLITLELHGVF